jgi:SAM-dependent methyltransferase
VDNKFIDKYFINPVPEIGLDTYLIRLSLINAVKDLGIKIGGDVLDLGCGIMPYKEYLLNNKNVISYKGMDLKDSQYHNAIQPDIYWDGVQIPLPDKSQDWVIITEFLEHYFDTRHILNEIYRVLKPGGKIFFTVPSLYVLHEVPYDYHRFTYFSLEKYFQITNFKQIEIYPLGNFNYSLLIILSLWKKYSNAKFSSKFFVRVFLCLFHKKLMAQPSNFWTLQNSSHFQNYQLPSGLWGYATKLD